MVYSRLDTVRIINAHNCFDSQSRMANAGRRAKSALRDLKGHQHRDRSARSRWSAQGLRCAKDVVDSGTRHNLFGGLHRLFCGFVRRQHAALVRRKRKGDRLTSRRDHQQRPRPSEPSLSVLLAFFRHIHHYYAWLAGELNTHLRDTVRVKGMPARFLLSDSRARRPCTDM